MLVMVPPETLATAVALLPVALMLVMVTTGVSM